MYNIKNFFSLSLFKLKKKKSIKSYGLPVLYDWKTANTHKLVEADILIQDIFSTTQVLFMHRKLTSIPNFYSSSRIYFLHSSSLLYEIRPVQSLYCKKATVTESNPYIGPCVSPHILTTMNSMHLNNPN